MSNKKFIVTIIIVVLIDGLAVFGWFYSTSFLKSQSDLIKGEEQSIAVNDKKFQNNNSLKTLMEGISDEKQKIDSAFLNKDNVVNFVEELETIAVKASTTIKIGNINIDNPSEEGVSVEFSLDGNFEEIFHYLVLMENLPYSLGIERMDLRASSPGDWSADFRILVTSFIKT